MPTVSVCMITYNHEKYIRGALESILMQETKFPFEVIVGEDCSTDSTREIVTEYSQKHPDVVKVITSKENVGVSANLRRTLKECNGQYLAFLDGDDYWIDPLKLQKQVDFLENNPEYTGVSGVVKIVHENTNKQQLPSLIEEPFQEQDISMYSYLKPTKEVYLQTLMIRRNLINPEDFVYLFGDVFVQLEVLKHGPIKHLPYLFTVYRKHAGGVTNSLFKEKRRELFGDLIKVFSDLNKQTNFKYDKILDTRLFGYTVCYKFSQKKLTFFKKLTLAFSLVFSRSFFKSPSLLKVKIVLFTALKGSYSWNSM